MYRCERPSRESHYSSTGAVAVVTSLECLDWLEDLLNELMVPGEDLRPHYRGMPLVILAVDGHPKEGTVYKTCLFHSYIVHSSPPPFLFPFSLPLSLLPSLPFSLPLSLPPSLLPSPSLPPSSLTPSYLPPSIAPSKDELNGTDSTSNADSELWRRAKNLANRVQVVCITEHLAVVPKRLVVTSVIHTLLVSLMDAVAHCDQFLNSDLSPEPEGLK